MGGPEKYIPVCKFAASCKVRRCIQRELHSITEEMQSSKIGDELLIALTEEMQSSKIDDELLIALAGDFANALKENGAVCFIKLYCSLAATLRNSQNSSAEYRRAIFIIHICAACLPQRKKS